MEDKLIKRDDLIICPLEDNTVFQGGLDTIEKDIHECNRKIGRGVLEVAYYINAVYDAKLFEKTHKNIDSWAEDVFGYKKTWTHNCIKAAKMIDCVKDAEGQLHYISCFGNKDHDFKLTQLTAMQYLTEGQIKDLMDEGKLTYDMTVKKIEDVVWDVIHEEDDEKKKDDRAVKKIMKQLKQAFSKDESTDKPKSPIKKDLPDLQVQPDQSSQPEKVDDETIDLGEGEVVIDKGVDMVDDDYDEDDEAIMFTDQMGGEYWIPVRLYNELQQYKI